MSVKKTPRIRRATSPSCAFGDPLDESTARLALLAPVAPAPSPAVKEALLARIRASQGGAGSPSRPGIERSSHSGRLGEPAPPWAAWRFGSLAGNEGWVRLPFPGVRMREISVDAARDTALVYIEMEPGAIFPDHDHSSAERGIVLTGDFEMGGRLLRAGEFYEAAAGTRHERIASPAGCTGLLWVGAAAWGGWRKAMAAAAAQR